MSNEISGETWFEDILEDGYQIVSSHSDGSEHFLVLQKGSDAYIVRILGHELSKSLGGDPNLGISNMTLTRVFNR